MTIDDFCRKVMDDFFDECLKKECDFLEFKEMVEAFINETIENQPKPEYPKVVNDYGFLSVIRSKEEDWTLTQQERLK